MLFDLDHFKKVNDNFGHQTGDWALRRAVIEAKLVCRKVDVIGRMGGEEFLLIAIETNIEQAISLAERIRNNVEAIHHPHQPNMPITISIGVAEGNKQTSLDELIAQADHALYQSKKNGRNQVSHYQEPTR